MFETEDMLPRPPPKPSAPPLSNEGFIKPEVPEVSIIFGKTNKTQDVATQQPTSYADWKKKVLPLVNQQPGFKDEINVNKGDNVLTTARSTVFPLRTIPTFLPQVQKSDHLNIMSSADKIFRHSLENEIGSATCGPSNCIQKNEHRRSVDSLSQRSSAFSTERALTICASTQTDFTTIAGASSKQEFEFLKKTLNELQEEQRLTRRLLETFMMQQEQLNKKQVMVSNVFCCDMATQCDILQGDPAHNVMQQTNFHIEDGTVHQALPNVKIYSPALDVARPTITTTQSTQYHANTPLKFNTQKVPPIKLTPTSSSITSLPKPCTEKSIAMNELALKYLPSGKINELMQDINIAETTPLREIDNFSKNPADISTASFHYLRKYRLLPHQQKQQNEGSTPGNGVAISENTFSPQRRPLQNSPIVDSFEAESPNLDLEHIKRQPKYL